MEKEGERNRKISTDRQYQDQRRKIQMVCGRSEKFEGQTVRTLATGRTIDDYFTFSEN